MKLSSKIGIVTLAILLLAIGLTNNSCENNNKHLSCLKKASFKTEKATENLEYNLLNIKYSPGASF
jgi:hypothetical protein